MWNDFENFKNIEKFGNTLSNMSLADIKPFISETNLLAKSAGAGATALEKFTDKFQGLLFEKRIYFCTFCPIGICYFLSVGLSIMRHFPNGSYSVSTYLGTYCGSIKRLSDRWVIQAMKWLQDINFFLFVCPFEFFLYIWEENNILF